MAKNEAASGIRVLYIAYIEGILNTFMSDTKSLDMWYSAKFVQIMVMWSKWHRPGGHRVYGAVIVH